MSRGAIVDAIAHQRLDGGDGHQDSFEFAQSEETQRLCGGRPDMRRASGVIVFVEFIVLRK